MWLDLLQCAFPVYSFLRPPVLPCEAFADACADSCAIGLGGFIKLPSGTTLCFQCRFTRAELIALVPWFTGDMSSQSFIATWELLAQLGLVWLLHHALPIGHLPVCLEMH